MRLEKMELEKMRLEKMRLVLTSGISRAPIPYFVDMNPVLEFSIKSHSHS